MSLKNPPLNHKNTPFSQGDLMNSVAEFMAEVGLTDEKVTAFNVLLACEFVYQPEPRFWREFDISMMFARIADRFLSWTTAVTVRGLTEKEVTGEVRTVLRERAFCEELAEFLMSTSKIARPTTSGEALRWLLKLLGKQRRYDLLRYLKTVGEWAVEQAFEVVASLESVGTDNPHVRDGTFAARDWRDRQLAKQGAAPGCCRVAQTGQLLLF